MKSTVTPCLRCSTVSQSLANPQPTFDEILRQNSSVTSWLHMERNPRSPSDMITSSKEPAVQTRLHLARESKPPRRFVPRQEVLQRSWFVLLFAHDAVSLLLLHLPNARREGVDVVEHGLHGDGDFVRLLKRGKEIVF